MSWFMFSLSGCLDNTGWALALCNGRIFRVGIGIWTNPTEAEGGGNLTHFGTPWNKLQQTITRQKGCTVVSQIHTGSLHPPQAGEHQPVYTCTVSHFGDLLWKLPARDQPALFCWKSLVPNFYSIVQISYWNPQKESRGFPGLLRRAVGWCLLEPFDCCRLYFSAIICCHWPAAEMQPM